MPKVRKIPQRMCVGCQEMKPKKEMIRVVKTPENSIEIDPTGKRAGRGAYVCPSLECLQKAIKARRLEKALHHSVSPEIIDVLKQGLVK
ncbi:RNase P modulator RnpM [Desulfofarcimen acetoxidans]|uniref:RNase P modulator RnpM n=1 Tax=Desulfofarcimen acetoxidans TaxID=58138 RepID=UPI0005A6BBC0|nr:YlxR family protein [Desulfofarcimen acetoxidans]